MSSFQATKNSHCSLTARLGTLGVRKGLPREQYRATRVPTLDTNWQLLLYWRVLLVASAREAGQIGGGDGSEEAGRLVGQEEPAKQPACRHLPAVAHRHVWLRT